MGFLDGLIKSIATRQLDSMIKSGDVDKLFQDPMRLHAMGGLLQNVLRDESFMDRVSKDNKIYQNLGKLQPDSVAPKATFFDPMELVSQAQYKDKLSGLSFEVLKQMAERTEVVQAIINTRTAQLTSFGQPSRWKKNSLGYRIRYKDVNREPSKSEQERLNTLEEMFYSCGYTDRYRSGEVRPNFPEFLRRCLRDSLIYDQFCAEIVPNRAGEPAEWWSVDASTIRIANLNDPEYLEQITDGKDIIKYVQLYNGTIRHKFSFREMAFCVRNVRNDLKVNGYGFSELEQLINIITAILFAEEYNKRFFSNGSLINGILNLKGQNINQEMLEAFRRQWQTLATNASNSHKIPLLAAKEGIEFINLHSNNRDMEYSSWMEFLVKIATAVYLIDPAEVNFDYRGASESAPLFESSPEAKLKHSRDKGLRNLLNFFEEKVNFHLLHPIDSNLYFEFVGIDMKDEQEMVNLRTAELAGYKTMNEVRKDAGLPPISKEEGGDMILNPVLQNALQQQQAQQQQEQMMQQQQEQMMQQQGQPEQQAEQSGEQEEPQHSEEELKYYDPDGAYE